MKLLNSSFYSKIMEIYTVNCNLNKISNLSIYSEFKKKGKLIEKKKYFVNTVYS